MLWFRRNSQITIATRELLHLRSSVGRSNFRCLEVGLCSSWWLYCVSTILIFPTIQLSSQNSSRKASKSLSKRFTMLLLWAHCPFIMFSDKLQTCILNKCEGIFKNQRFGLLITYQIKKTFHSFVNMLWLERYGSIVDPYVCRKPIFFFLISQSQKRSALMLRFSLIPPKDKKNHSWILITFKCYLCHLGAM